MDPIVSAIATLAPGLGIVAGGVGYVLRIYNEDRRIARTVLFNLLGIWEVCHARSNPPEELIDAALSQYKSVAKDLLGAEAVADLERPDHGFESAFREVLHQFIVASLPQLTDELQTRYLASLSKLSERHPVLAYRLSGREKLQDVFEAISEYETRAGDAVLLALSAQEYGGLLATGQRMMRTSFTKSLLDSIETDVKRVAWAAGFFNWLWCLRAIRRSKKRKHLDPKEQREMRQQLADALQQLADAHVAQQKAKEGTTTP